MRVGTSMAERSPRVLAGAYPKGVDKTRGASASHTLFSLTLFSDTLFVWLHSGKSFAWRRSIVERCVTGNNSIMNPNSRPACHCRPTGRTRRRINASRSIDLRGLPLKDIREMLRLLALVLHVVSLAVS